mmetsp:Transcript_96461/g.191073  ORF Transcript_96461/g.191073 Transcript_96461/m.191073 type:complete len:219 (-) Transcript_96461:630-1286(-)
MRPSSVRSETWLCPQATRKPPSSKLAEIAGSANAVTFESSAKSCQAWKSPVLQATAATQPDLSMPAMASTLPLWPSLPLLSSLQVASMLSSARSINRSSPSACPTRKWPSSLPVARHVTAEDAAGYSIEHPLLPPQTQISPKSSPEATRPPGKISTAVIVVTWPMMIVRPSLHSMFVKVWIHVEPSQTRTVWSNPPVATRPSSPTLKHVTNASCPRST